MKNIAIGLALAFASFSPVQTASAQDCADICVKPNGKALKGDALRSCKARFIVDGLNAQNMACYLPELYSAEVKFEDPTTVQDPNRNVEGLDGPEGLFAYLSETYALLELQDVTIENVIGEGQIRAVNWISIMQLKIPGTNILVGEPVQFDGTTVLKFDCNDQVVSHHDYFDQFPLYAQVNGFFETAQGMLFSLFGAPPAP